MKRIALVPALLATLCVAAHAAEPAAPPRPAAPPGAAVKPQTLDDLFKRLAAAKDETEAGGIARLVERRLGRSGSDTADLLMERAGEALEAKDAPLAIELLDRVTGLKPDWAEAWNRRAAAFFVLDDPVGAMADLSRALSREPRLYSAWLALGRIEMGSDNKGRALAAYRRALAIDPFLPEAKAMVDRLAPGLDGRDI